MNINKIIADELNIKEVQVDSTIKLIDEGNTIPFIARYRKEVTGSLDDEILRKLGDRLNYLRNLEERKATILNSIEDQGKLTDELKSAIEEAKTLAVLEDLYRPYKQKRKTKASIAKEKGLESLAKIILEQNTSEPIEVEAEKYVDEEKNVLNVNDAIKGASDIIAEEISDNANFRKWIRNYIYESGEITSEAKDFEKESVYEMYYQFSEQIKKIVGHRILALNRGEKEKVLTVKIEADEEKILTYLINQVKINENKYTLPIIKEAIIDSYNRLIKPSIENEIRNDLTEKAEDGAIEVFGKNLAQLLMQPPIKGKTVLGWDPAFRTGCKIAVVDPTGKVLDTTVVYPTAPTTQVKIDSAKKEIKELIEKHNVDLISLGNGTASRESEQFIVELIKELPNKVEYVIVNEAGASVYSASKLATEEFPNLNVGERSSASMARRLQDPLSELVKIEPKAIGVGQYQHDMNQKKLEESLSGVVEASVNKVGVDLNTASFSLLSYVAGISKTVAKNIVDYREENGEFKSRKELLKVPKLGPKAFEQCAGFLRIYNGKEPLDATSVHPESYKSTEALFKLAQIDKKELTKLKKTDENKKPENEKNKPEKIADNSYIFKLKKYINSANLEETSKQIGIGKETLQDILDELEKPGRDPRSDMPKPILKSDILEIEDLKEGMVLKGTVRNIIDFGAFVDIGVHQDGLVHISELSNRYVKHPLDVVSIGDIVDVKVLGIDSKKNRISLTMKDVNNK